MSVVKLHKSVFDYLKNIAVGLLIFCLIFIVFVEYLVDYV